MADEDNEQNPWTKPGFVAAAFVVAIIVTLGVVLAVVTATRDDGQEAANPAPSPTSTAPTANPTAAAGGASVCGLNGVGTTGRLSQAPVARWAFQGTVAYPSSPKFGPAKAGPDGVRYCYQHTPEGALFMAANALAQASDPEVSPAWARSALGQGQYRDELLSDIGASGADPSGIRLSIAGFRLLHYDGESARVDLGVRGSSKGTTITASAVYDLVWQDGDWKISASKRTPFDFATIPDLAGYIPWGA